MNTNKQAKTHQDYSALIKLLAGLSSLAVLVVFFPLVIFKINAAFPGMTFVGWLVLTTMFVVTVALCTPISVWIENRWHWPEDRAQYLPVIISVLFWIILIWYYWDSLAPWFGKSA